MEGAIGGPVSHLAYASLRRRLPRHSPGEPSNKGEGSSSGFFRNRSVLQEASDLTDQTGAIILSRHRECSMKHPDVKVKMAYVKHPKIFYS